MRFLAGIELRELGSDTYIADLPVVQGLLRAGPLRFKSPVTFLVGENGSGKSTLVEAMAVGMGFNAEGGSRDTLFSAENSVSELHQWLTLQRVRNPRDGYFLRGESTYRLAIYLDKEVGGTAPLLPISHGEMTLKLLRERFHGRGLYLLDEPESGLSPESQLELMARIAVLAEMGAQFIVATHSPIVLAVPGAEIWQITDSGVVPANYDSCDLVAGYLEFMADPHGTADYLCSEDE
ncbi:AAA family ATPase [Corynebacterium sp. H127]|uniref:AAA family ATPase n=1 Tax=Corynebacterium sp. H127 TaxID=3133418 RepID=UPI0030A36E8A